MLTVEFLPESNIFQMEPIMDIEENSEWKLSESVNDNNRDSISPITIPLKSSQPILAASSKYILTNEYTNKRKRLIIIDDNLYRFSINSRINETIIDAVWCETEKKFLLLTKRKIYTLDPESKIIEEIQNIKPNDLKPFKSFSIIDHQSSFLIAYDEWESKYIDKWEQDNENQIWKLSKSYLLNLTSNEYVGNIFANIKDKELIIGITIYNNLTKEWRMDLRHGDELTCLKTVLLPGSNPNYDYNLIEINSETSDIKWLVYSQVKNMIIAIDANWKKKDLNYKFPVNKMVHFKENNLIIRSRNKLDIHLFV